MNHDLPPQLVAYLAELDDFIDQVIRPLEAKDDNIRFFDHRREDARTDWERGGLPNEEWEALLLEAKRLADEAGHFRYPFPKEYGGREGTNLDMAVIREHLAAKGLGLHNDLQNEHSIVGNNVGLLLLLHYGSEEQKAQWLDRLATGRGGFTFGITEPDHGSDATHMETTGVRDGDDWILNGEKSWNTGIHKASHSMVMARTGGKAGDGNGITAFLTPTDAPGFKVEEMLWTFNMPTDHGRYSLTNVRVSDSAIFGEEGRGLQIVQHFFNENRIRQAASSLGAAQFCVNESVEYAKARESRSESPCRRTRRSSSPSSSSRRSARCSARSSTRRPGRWTSTAPSPFPTRCRCATTGRTVSAAKRPTARCRSTAAWATRATSPSSTSTVTTGATGSPKAQRRSRCDAWPATCSGS